MLDTPYQLSKILPPDSGFESRAVNIDELISRRLPIGAHGDLRLEVSIEVMKALVGHGTLDGPKENVIAPGHVVVPFKEDYIKGWQTRVVVEFVGKAFCFIEGSGALSEGTDIANPCFTIKPSGVLARAERPMVLDIPSIYLKGAVSSDFIFENPKYQK